VAALFKAWTDFFRPNTGVVGSNPNRGMYISLPLFCVCVVLLLGSALAADWSSVEGVPPTEHRIKKLKERPRAKGL
jgi:hypothetical protein